MLIKMYPADFCTDSDSLEAGHRLPCCSFTPVFCV